MDERGEALSYIRDTLDKRTIGHTHDSRVLKLTRFLMASTYPEDDALTFLAPYFIPDTELNNWYKVNSKKISELRKQSPKDRRTDRYDLEDDISELRSSKWLENATTCEQLFPFNPEALEASLAVKSLYQLANNDYTDSLHTKK